MSQPFLNLALIVTRLAGQVTDLKRVAEAVDLASAEDDIKNLSVVAYVVPARDPAGPNTLANAVDQLVTSTFGVVIGIKNFRDPRGDAARAQLTPIRSAVCDALLNWQPGADYTACEFSGGRLARLTDQVLWWVDEYRTTFRGRKTKQNG